MSYPHMQGSMGTTGYEPKFPPSETDFHHFHHHHSGYGGMNGLSNNHVDYSYHNGYNYGHANYTPTPTTPFYPPHHHPPHPHHPPYGSPQMHHSTNNTPSPNISTAPQSNSSYVLSNNNSSGIGNRNSTTIPNASTTAATTVTAVVNGLNVSETSSNVDNSLGFFNNYYASTNGHHDPQDLPLQCPTIEPPANTALGLQELGKYQIFGERKKILCSDVSARI